MPKKILLLSGATMFGIGLVAILSYNGFNHQPTSTALQVTSSAIPAPPRAVSLTPFTQRGTLVSFDYPAGMHQVATQVSGPIVAAYSYSAQDITSWFLAVTITKTAPDQLEQLASFKLRQNNPSRYQRSEVSINNQTYVVFADRSASGFSQVAFSEHGNYVATIALLGNDASGTEPLKAAWHMVIGSVHWTE